MRRGWWTIGRWRGAGGWGLARVLALIVPVLSVPVLIGPVLIGMGQVAAAKPAVKSDRALQDALLGHIKVLASDEFGGREPGTEGETKTLRYIGRQLFDMGLVSGTNQPGNPWFAPVRLVGREPAGSVAQFAHHGRAVPVASSEILMTTSGRRSLVQNAPLVFVGRARSIPSRVEIAGRVAVMLDDGGQGYDGAAEARQNALIAGGAAAVISILDGQRTLAGVRALRARAGYALASEALGGDMEGFVSLTGAGQLLGASLDSLASLQREADRVDFTPRLLDITANLEATTRETTIRSHNIIGRLPGRYPERGAVVLMAHWDHFGLCAKPPAEHLICNGAVDNASGVAAMLEVARRLARVPGGLERDVFVVATTGEELGLLGAEAFAESPPLPLSRIVAVFNLDSVAIAPVGSPLGVVGRGMTPLDGGIVAVAREQKRRLAETTVPLQYVRRQDGWALMSHDLPAVMVTSAYGEIARLEHFFATDYHRPLDVVKPELELGGAGEDVNFHVALVQYFADSMRYPGVAGLRDGARSARLVR